MKNNKLVIDAQVFQTPAWHRGMGKYSWELVKALNKQEKYSSITLILNTQLSLPDGFEKLMNEELTGVASINVDLRLAEQGDLQQSAMVSNAQALTNTLIENKLEGATFLILSPFSDELAPAFPSNSLNTVLVYDLIPFLFHERYLARIDYKNYLSRFKLLFEADILFSISETVKKDLVSNLGISDKKITNINGSLIGEFSVKSKKPDFIKKGDNFILMPTGDELRKNNSRAVRAFEIFRNSTGSDAKLITTSFFSDYTKNELNSMSDAIIFSGNIPEAELIWLYENAQCLLFPSEYEGLGMPVLEAVRANLPIACSDIEVFKEMSQTAFYYFHPHDVQEMSHALAHAYSANRELSETEKKEYSSILKKYTWKNSAKELIDKASHIPLEKLTDKKPRIAILCPSVDGYSAIGKVVAESHDAMSKHFEITYFYDEGPNHRFMRPDFLRYIANTEPVTNFTMDRYVSYDFVIYHIGNSEYHMRTLLRALYMPGIVIMHDTHLKGLYNNLLQYGAMSVNRIDSEIALTKIFKAKKSADIVSVINAQRGVIAHSNYAIKAIEEVDVNDVLVQHANLPTVNMITQERKRDHTKKIKIGVAGILADVKGLDIIESAANSPRFEDCEFHLFGLSTGDLKRRLHKLPNIIIAEDPTDYDFQKRMSNLDILINYRVKYHGETSLTTIEAMKYGVTVIVRDIGWYSELPDNAVIKVKKQEAIEDVIANLIDDPKLLASISRNAAQFIADECSHNLYAENILQLMNKITTKQA